MGGPARPICRNMVKIGLSRYQESITVGVMDSCHYLFMPLLLERGVVDADSECIGVWVIPGAEIGAGLGGHGTHYSCDFLGLGKGGKLPFKANFQQS